MNRTLIILFLFLFLAACSENSPSAEQPSAPTLPRTETAVSTETPLPPSPTPTEKPRKTIYFDLRYVEGGYSSQRLSIYLPEDAADHPDAKYPTVFMAHAWYGSPDASPQKELIGFLRELGYASVTIDYRMGEDDGGPWTAISDGYCALAWVYANANDYGLDVNRMVGFGNSYGAHIVSNLALTNDIHLFQGDCPVQLPKSGSFLGVIVFGGSIFGIPGDEMIFGTDAQADILEEVHYGPASEVYKVMQKLSKISPLEWAESDLTDEERKLAQIQPSYWVNKDAPPFLIMVGELDRWTPKESEAFADLIVSVGGTATYVLLPDTRHMEWSRLDNTSWQEPVQQFLEEFLPINP